MDVVDFHSQLLERLRYDLAQRYVSALVIGVWLILIKNDLVSFDEAVFIEELRLDCFLLKNV